MSPIAAIEGEWLFLWHDASHDEGSVWTFDGGRISVPGAAQTGRYWLADDGDIRCWLPSDASFHGDVLIRIPSRENGLLLPSETAGGERVTMLVGFWSQIMGGSEVASDCRFVRRDPSGDPPSVTATA